MASILIFIMTQFSLVMFLLAIVFIIFHRALVAKSVPDSEIIFRWMAFFGLGWTGIYTFIIHAFFPQASALSIGWTVSPFQYEVAMADLAIGVLGILSFQASFGFRLATVIASICFLWGDAINHLYQVFFLRNYMIGNAGSWLWMDILIPLILVLCLIKLRPRKLTNQGYR